MARLPLAVPDFHEVSHHHSATEPCLLHEHLNRWHGDAQEHGDRSGLTESHDSLLHWHWLLPGNGPMNHEPGQNSDEGSSQDDPLMNLMIVSNMAEEDSFAWMILAEVPDLMRDATAVNCGSALKFDFQIAESWLLKPDVSSYFTVDKINCIGFAFHLDLNIRLRC